jgi:hypothetical protein
VIAALFAVAGAAGLAALLLSEDRRLRLAGLVAVAVGVAGLASWLVSAHRLLDDARGRCRSEGRTPRCSCRCTS